MQQHIKSIKTLRYSFANWRVFEQHIGFQP